MKKKTINHASIFSGIGGAEIAASRMGWNNAFHCEIEEFPRKTLGYWFPNSKCYEDVTKTDFSPWRGRIDVLTGGFPCQPFSVAGKRRGEEDDRYLWNELLRAAREIQPAWLVFENVTGILSMVQPGREVEMGSAGNLFEESRVTREVRRFIIDSICDDIERAGYAVQPFVIPACAVGAPHRRDRVWLVAHRTDARAESVRQGRENEVHEPGIAADALRARLQEAGEELETAGVSGIVPLDADARSERRNALGDDDGQPDGSPQEECGAEQLGGADCPQDWWREFPTQSPVCRRDDGLPFGVDDLALSFPKWRGESIKALGNAWVPQVAYEIFRAIDMTENLMNK